jgi:hypothetical protein
VPDLRLFPQPVKPPKNVLRIYYHQDEAYQSDFVVETITTRYLCEPKHVSEMTDVVVTLKAKAAALWCQYATTVSDKPWRYVLIPTMRSPIVQPLISFAGGRSCGAVVPHRRR